jgi:hypothetical protein
VLVVVGCGHTLATNPAWREVHSRAERPPAREFSAPLPTAGTYSTVLAALVEARTQAKSHGL